jgi:deoxyribodipyrimidine photolyase-related protein
MTKTLFAKSGFTRILLIPFDHLNADRGVLKNADPTSDIVLLVQSERMVAGRHFHKERLFFLISSARHFAMALEKSGFTVLLIEAETTVSEITYAREAFGELQLLRAGMSPCGRLTEKSSSPEWRRLCWTAWASLAV